MQWWLMQDSQCDVNGDIFLHVAFVLGCSVKRVTTACSYMYLYLYLYRYLLGRATGGVERLWSSITVLPFVATGTLQIFCYGGAGSSPLLNPLHHSTLFLQIPVASVAGKNIVLLLTTVHR
jgi:hypothetical protein